jgi:hypothetical protein
MIGIYHRIEFLERLSRLKVNKYKYRLYRVTFRFFTTQDERIITKLL